MAATHTAPPRAPGALPAPLSRAIGRLQLNGNVAARLDLARGVAAMLVMWNHMRALLFVEYRAVAPAHLSLATRAVYFLTGFGHAAVIVFFVLSGLLISASVLRAYEDRRWSWEWYLTQRFTRLYVVLIPALLLGAAWDRAGMALFGTHGVYGGFPGAAVLAFATPDRAGAATFLGNAVFLQEIVVAPFGSNAPLWSLSYEFWYYAIFPALLLACIGRGAARRLAAAAAACAMLLLVGPVIRIFFGIWLLGFAALLLPLHRGGRRWSGAMLVAAGAAVAGTLALVRIEAFPSPFAADAALGVAFLALVCAILRAGPGTAAAGAQPARRGRGIPARLAGFSYTLYLVHMPLLVFLSALVAGNGAARWQPDAAHLLLLAPVSALVLGYAYGVAQLTEERTAQVRRWVVRMLARRPGGVAAAAGAGG